mgnify:CR=1 FL=1
MHHYAKAIAYAFQRQFDQAEEQRQLFHAGTSRDAAGALHSSGGRVLAVVAQGDSFDAAFAKAYSGLEQVDFEGITYRRDIGHQVRTDA